MSGSSPVSPQVSKSTPCFFFRNLCLFRKKNREKSSVNTGGGAHFGNAHFTGGGHAFGSNSTVNNNLTIIRFGDSLLTDVQRNWICDYIANNAVLPAINDRLNRNFLTQSIINLPRAEAMFNDYETKKKCGPCFEGTRVALLREMADWVTGPSESRMYVLSGLAGIGKSTIAYTIASRAADLNLLGASFFFARDEADRKNAKKLFTTIAYQLCVYNETFAKAIGDVLLTERGSAATTKDPQEQLQTLIVEPLRTMVQSRARPVLIVVDALDECDEEDELSVLTGLRRFVRDLPSFKIILTTRPQPQLDLIFGIQDDHKIVRLQDIEDKIVDGDIRLYLKYSLSLEQVRKRHPTRQWSPSDEQIDALVRAAGRLFIIASTAVRFILDKAASNPAAQMQKLLRASAQDRMPFKDLNEFYNIILRNIVPVDCDDDDIISRYQSVVGAIALIQHPLPVTTLAQIIDIDVEEIRAVLINLQSVILLGDDDVPRIYHKSFPDYITDLKRCQDVNLYIDPKIGHTRITIRCLQLMEQHLKYNILGLGDPARFMSNEGGLAKDGITSERLEKKIPQQLQYACAYWANHLEAANTEGTDLMNKLEEFAYKRMLHWFEALSLTGKLDSAHRAIRIVLNLLKPAPSGFHHFLSDALRFISKFYDLIKRSALHTYYSALPFTPTDSLFYRQYIKEASNRVCDISGVSKSWDALIANLRHDELIRHIQFSLDNSVFSSQSHKGNRSKGMLKVWDAATGTPISMIRGSGFGIADDFSTIASFEDNVITLYNVNGSEQGATFKTRETIYRMAFSSETSRIVAMTSDGTVFLWDSRNGELVGRYDNDSYGRDRLQFSTTGARLAYSSVNPIVKLRNGIDGRLIADLDCGLADGDFSRIKFSRDGSRIASLRPGSGLKLWCCEAGELIGAAENVDSIMEISTTGSFLATGEATKVTMWSGNSGNSLPPVERLDLDLYLESMAFSPNDVLAITTGSNIKLYNIESHSFTATLSFMGSVGTPVAFSPDCSHLAAGNSTGIVSLWDIRGIEATCPPSNKQASGQVTALALSPDCSRVACGFADGAIELWETDGFTKQKIDADTSKAIRTLGFSPDGKQFASGSADGIINLWNGEDGALCGALQYPTESDSLYALDISNGILAAAGDNGIILWDLETLDHIHTFMGSFLAPLAFSTDGALLAASTATSATDAISATLTTLATLTKLPTTLNHSLAGHITVFDVTKRTNIATFDVSDRRIRAMTFLPDNSELVLQLYSDEFLTFNLVEENVIRQQPTFENIVQLPNMSLWHGVPVWVNLKVMQLRALFSLRDEPVPVLWIPRELRVWRWAQRRSVIALGCEGGRVVLLRLPTTHVI